MSLNPHQAMDLVEFLGKHLRLRVTASTTERWPDGCGGKPCVEVQLYLDQVPNGWINRMHWATDDPSGRSDVILCTEEAEIGG
jgi:hypothetical protein